MITANTTLLENVKTSAEWASSNPILPARVKGYDSTVKHYKIGDGSTAWLDLPFWEAVTQPTTVEIDVPAGTTLSSGAYLIQMQPDYDAFGNNPTIIFKQYQSGSVGRSPANLKPLQVDYTENCFNGKLQLLTINFPDDGTGHTLDHWMVVLKA